MTLANFDGGWSARIGWNVDVGPNTPTTQNATVDAVNEAVIYIGQIVTSDGGSHTIDTSGSSALNWRTAAVTFANAGTTAKIGLAAVDMTTGSPGRLTNTANVIDFDVSKTMVGSGSPAITLNAWNTHVPDAGTKTIANGDLVAFAIQLTARAGADTIALTQLTSVSTTHLLPFQTNYLSATYTGINNLPNCMITFSDGAKGWFYDSEVFSTITATAWNSGSATKEHGQLFKIPFPMKIYGIYGIASVSNDFDTVLYSDPLGTPVAEKTVAIDANIVGIAASGRRFTVLFPSPYTTAADQLIVAAFKPGAGNLSAWRKTLGNAADRITDIWGVDGYGVGRATGAFSDFNSSLDHFYIGLLVGGLDNGVGGGGGLATPLFGGGVI